MTPDLALGDRDPGYLTHREVDAALELFPLSADAHWVATDSAEARDLLAAAGHLAPARDAVPEADRRSPRSATASTPAFPSSAPAAASSTPSSSLPGARAGIADAAHEESDPDAPEPVVIRLACTLYGEVRTVTPVPGTRFAEICGPEPFEGFHWCGYGLDPRYVEPLERAGIVVGATAADAGVEAIELPDHPFFLATAFQPQVGASTTRQLGSVLEAFVAAASASRLSLFRTRPKEQ